MEVLAILANGKRVFVDLESSHFATHLADCPSLSDLANTFLSSQSFTDDEVCIDFNAERIVGLSDLVETVEGDHVLYAKRINRETYTRFVKNKKPSLTSYVTLVLTRIDCGHYELLTAWFGRICPPFPDDPKATPESQTFWETHALVWGNQSIQPETETSLSPWRRVIGN